MKSKKQSTTQEIITLVIDQISSQFLPDPKMIKKRIESLIERDYLQRDSNDITKLLYLA